jgi:hypothetical protein
MNEPVVLDALHSGRWQDVTSFAKVNAQDMASRKPSVVQTLCIWLKSVDLYHQTEMDVIPGGYPSEQDRQEQKFTLSVLINVGEWLVRHLRQNDVTANVGVTLADVEATLEELYINQRITFGGMTEERRKQVLDEVFGAA